jgi:hypothetical protein
MPITAPQFFQQYKKVKEYLADGTKGSQELRDAFKALNDGFRITYQTEQFKEALTTNALIPDDLEERLTSSLILLNQEKARE